jgi:hypothetical protein
MRCMGVEHMLIPNTGERTATRLLREGTYLMYIKGDVLISTQLSKLVPPKRRLGRKNVGAQILVK